MFYKPKSSCNLFIGYITLCNSAAKLFDKEFYCTNETHSKPRREKVNITVVFRVNFLYKQVKYRNIILVFQLLYIDYISLRLLLSIYRSRGLENYMKSFNE